MGVQCSSLTFNLTSFCLILNTQPCPILQLLSIKKNNNNKLVLVAMIKPIHVGIPIFILAISVRKWPFKQGVGKIHFKNQK